MLKICIINTQPRHRYSFLTDKELNDIIYYIDSEEENKKIARAIQYRIAAVQNVYP